ncbi:lipid-A-disaccharide synthase N-terminal domain-containing protein [Candidatus Methylacidiphilum infernorum]|uniref:Predicted membrane protein n=1 Tax=Methylacidiphilum infernorum (isolate V4) TaxID=481448 RepID=B3DZT7_METI4|nr:lipid-A-disaccharide synthase N-terminal domain-containing protein [Candidatus Methylacidiphilum infernorum]ACD84272.1 Predicted membrane protein [Methylacidiphilum infernorum V4]
MTSYGFWVATTVDFLGIHWSPMKVIGWIGNILFFSRFIIQWIATEKKKAVVVPLAFWYCSLLGSLLLLIYAFYRWDSVFIFAYLFSWIPYSRNLYFAHKERMNSKNNLSSGFNPQSTQASYSQDCPQDQKAVKKSFP